MRRNGSRRRLWHQHRRRHLCLWCLLLDRLLLRARPGAESGEGGSGDVGRGWEEVICKGFRWCVVGCLVGVPVATPRPVVTIGLKLVGYEGRCCLRSRPDTFTQHKMESSTKVEIGIRFQVSSSNLEFQTVLFSTRKFIMGSNLDFNFHRLFYIVSS